MICYATFSGSSGLGYEVFCSAGFSSGGILSVYAALLFNEISCCISSGALSTFKKLFVDKDSCECSIIPGIIQHADFPDIYASIAPKLLFVQSGLNDSFTGINTGSDECFNKIKNAYSLMNCNSNLRIDLHDNGHNYDSISILKWLEEYFC